MCSHQAARAGERGTERVEEHSRKPSWRERSSEKHIRKPSWKEPSSEMESTSSADQASPGAPFSEEQCQWLQRLAAQWTHSPPSGPLVHPSTSTTNSGDNSGGELARVSNVDFVGTLGGAATHSWAGRPNVDRSSVGK